jgi:hypothetical protein
MRTLLTAGIVSLTMLVSADAGAPRVYLLPPPAQRISIRDLIPDVYSAECTPFSEYCYSYLLIVRKHAQLPLPKA